MTRGRAAFVLGLVAVLGCHASAPPDARNEPPAEAAPLASAGCRAGAVAALAGERRTMVVDGDERHYLIDAPAGAGERPLPVVLLFHGFRGDAAELRAGVGFAPLAAAGEMIAVHAEGHDGVRLLGTTGRGWDMEPDDTRDLDFVRAIVDGLEAERCVDRRRVFAAGFSNGAFFANVLGCVLADRLAAVASVAGARALPDCRAPAPMPILFVQGDHDRIVPPASTQAAREWWRTTNGCAATGVTRDGCLIAAGCRADVVLCLGGQAHAWPADATDRIWRFFQSHPRA